MNQLMLTTKDEIKNDKICFVLKARDQRFLHIKNHLKLTKNDSIKVALLNKGRGVGEIAELNDKQLIIKISEPLVQNPEGPYKEAVIGLGRPKQMLKILEYGTQLGINKFQIIKCQLSEKSYLSSPLLTEEKIDETLLKALSQSAYFYHLPKVELKKYFPRAWREDCQKIALDPVIGTGMNELNLGAYDKLQFIMGPERGFTDDERKKLKLYDFAFTKLGPSILKSEVAFNFFLGRIGH